MSIRRQEAGGRRQEEEESSLPKKKLETSHIKGFGHPFAISIFSRARLGKLRAPN
ncbi:MAG: hypothetical protein F6K47_11840 [Symploca sp. SIO2E6]|nr:hypothetical protein [Symploca sp. SIO2E6]